MRKATFLMMLLGIIAMLCTIPYVTTDQGIGLCVQVIAKNGSEEIACWKKDDMNYFFYLPSYAELSNTILILHTDKPVYIDNLQLTDGMSCDMFRLNTPYEFTYAASHKMNRVKITFVKSSNVSTMYFDTESGSMDYIHAKKGNTEMGNMRLYRTGGELACTNAVKSIAGRGNTTWDDHEKKPYIFELENYENLLGMGSSDKWILLANANDASHIRNKMVYDFADDIGLEYSPKSEWVDLYLNGNYAGLYLLTEKNEVDDERIDIEKEKSFLVSVERKGRLVTQNLPYVMTNADQALRIRYPKNPTVDQIDSLTQEWQMIENAILYDNDYEAINEKSWLDLIDLDSWVKKYMIEEIFANLDACHISQYFYRDGESDDNRVYAGPVWDFDLSLGMGWQTDELNFMVANRLNLQEGIQTPWFHELSKKEEFHERIVELFQDEFIPLLEEIVYRKIDAYVDIVADAAKMNALRWDTESFELEVERICSFLLRRIEFLIDYWITEGDYNVIEARCEGANYAYYYVKNGECVGELPVIESTSLRTFLGWYYEDGAPFDFHKQVTEDICIYAKWSGAPAFFVMYGEYFMPLVLIAMMGVSILCVEINRSRKGKWRENDE